MREKTGLGNGDLKIVCVDCGKEFVFTEAEQGKYKQLGFVQPKRCYDCRRQRKKQRNENLISYKRDTKDRTVDEKAAEERLKKYHVVQISDITLSAETTLYIIGNGFDMMHEVHSSYYDFEKTLGMNNPLRFALDTYLNVDNLWADFEEALGHFNVSMMINPTVLDMWLDVMGDYDPDAQAADFFVAVDDATMPASTIINDLPRRVRMWVESLQCLTEKRPLRELILDGKVLSFNYTEFIENLYGVRHKNVCYIHGYRVKQKYHPKEELILGHRPGSEDEEWDKVHVKTPRFKDNYKKYIFESAVETASRNLVWYDEAMTKKSPDIIKNIVLFSIDWRR